MGRIKVKKSISIKVKLIILMIIIAFALSTVIGTVAISKSTATLNSKSDEELSNLAIRVDAEIQQFLEKNFAYLKGVAKSELAKNPEANMEEQKAMMKEAATSYGVEDMGVVNLSGQTMTDSGMVVDLSQRDWVQNAFAGQYSVSDPYEDSTEAGKMIMVFSGPVYNGEQIVGCIYMICDATYLSNITNSVSFGETGKAYMMSKTGTIIANKDPELVASKYNILELGESQAGEVSVAQLTEATKKIVEGTSGTLTYEFKSGQVTAGYTTNEMTGWKVVVDIQMQEVQKNINQMSKSFLLITIVLLIAAVVVGVLVISKLMKPLTLMKRDMNNLAKGDFTRIIPESKSRDEIGALQNAAHDLQKTIVGIINDENEILGAMANCDLSTREMPPLPGEFDKLSSSVNYIKATLRELVMEIQSSASQVDIGSREIAAATENLSQGTTAQAMSIDQVVNDTEEISERIITNSENEKTVERKLHELGLLINTGNDEMTALLGAVTEVEKMSADIQKIVATIDSISFQTNILALNASVEAARAGESGKGFAVVADEVGNLADKSGESSKQTSELIEQCLKAIKEASKCADRTFNCLGEIVKNSTEIENAFADITEATRLQAEKSANIKNEIESVSNVVQTNMATSEETAAASEELSAQAASMSNLIQKFIL